MCGIAGILDFNNKIEINKEILEKISQPNKNRGPDSNGWFLKKTDRYNLGFYHNRLSIIDLTKSANQPMLSESRRYLISFNGEIYNYKNLRKTLLKIGKNFNSNSDTEVILNAVDAWGIEKCLDTIDGMFAFAIFDLKERTLILARDRFGEKPLYYSISGGFISFSSDIRSFNHLPINKTINNHSLGYYFSEMCTPLNSTIWNEVKKVPPAHYLSINRNKLNKIQYWHLDYSQKMRISNEEIAQKTESIIQKSVKKQLTSDVEVGCFLSGGVDSSLISFYASKFYTKKIKTFSVGFKDQKFNELPYAKIVSKKINSDHHELIVDVKSLNTVNKLLEEYGEPFADVSSIPTFYITNFASNYVKVALGGDGGDELFGGYNTYLQGLRMQQWANFKVSHKLIKAFNFLFNFKKIKYLNGVISNNSSTIGEALFRNIGFNQQEIFKLTGNYDISFSLKLEHKRLINTAKNFTNNIFDSILHSSIKSRLVNDYLVKSDRASMYNSLELRSPFLDRELQEFLGKIDYNSLLYKKEQKAITKKLLSKYFSGEIIKRPKQGFEMPISSLIKNDWKKDISDVILSQNKHMTLNMNYKEELLKNHIKGREDNSKKIWNLYVLNLWIDKNFKN
tara:strand:+ start:197 stop:2062 length:1866 start_codon:yes stop_codon:yes gene_type:complete